MSRMQLALNVDDLDQAVTFYSKLFNTPPAKIKEGYANFAITEPPLKLVLSLCMTTTEGPSVTSDAGEGSGCGLSSAPPMWRRTVMQPMVARAGPNDAGHRDEWASSAK